MAYETDFRRGSALVIVLLLLFVMSILGVSILRTSLSETLFTKRQEDLHQSHYVAMSAANAFASHILINNDPASAKLLLNEIVSLSPTENKGMANVDVTALRAQDSRINSAILEVQKVDNSYHVRSVGSYDSVTSEISYDINEIPLFGSAIFSFNDITLNNSSEAEGNGAEFIAGGDVIADEDAIDMNSVVQQPDSASYVVSMQKALDTKYQFPDPGDFTENSLLSPPFSFNHGSVINDTNIYFGAIDTGTATGGSANIVYVNNNTTDDMYLLFDKLVIGNGYELRIHSPNARVFIYINGLDGDPEAMTVRGKIDTTVDTPLGNFVIQGKRTSPEVKQIYFETSSTPTQNNIIILAPDWDIVLNNSNNFSGSIIGNNVALRNSTMFEYPIGFHGLFSDDLNVAPYGYSYSNWMK